MTTTTNDELARLRTAFAELAGPPPEPEACPPSDRIWLAVRGELPPDELREILDHVAACPACAEDWRIAMAFEEEARLAGTVAPPKTFRFGMHALRPYLVAAALVVATVTGYQGYQLHQPKAPVNTRGGEQSEIRSLLPENHRILPRDGFVLRWTPVPEAESYTLQVSTSGLVPLFHTEGLTTTSCQVPESALAHLEPGTKIHWTVTPVSKDGSRSQGPTFQAFVQ